MFSGSFDKQERNVKEYLRSHLSESKFNELGHEEISAITHISSIKVKKLKDLNRAADKLKRGGLDNLSSLVLSIDNSKATEEEIYNFSTQISIKVDTKEAAGSIRNYISSFIEKINNREEEQERQLQQLRQETEKHIQETERYRQEAEKQRQERLALQEQAEKERQEKEKWILEIQELKRKLAAFEEIRTNPQQQGAASDKKDNNHMKFDDDKSLSFSTKNPGGKRKSSDSDDEKKQQAESDERKHDSPPKKNKHE